MPGPGMKEVPTDDHPEWHHEQRLIFLHADTERIAFDLLVEALATFATGGIEYVIEVTIGGYIKPGHVQSTAQVRPAPRLRSAAPMSVALFGEQPRPDFG